MPKFSRARWEDDELELSFREWNAHQIIELVDVWGLAHAPQSGDGVRVDDRAQVRTLADVWARASRTADASN